MTSTAGRTLRPLSNEIYTSSPHDPVGLGSAPALAATIRHTHRRMELPSPMRSLVQQDPVVQMYHVSSGTVENEAQSAAQMLMAVADRLRRLRSAYGAWHHFDASAYFDLSMLQTNRLLQISERVTTVHILFCIDALLPSFQTAEAFWQEDFRPHYLDLRNHLRQGDLPLAPVMSFTDRSQPQMIEHWQRLDRVIRATRALLDNEIGFWAANGSGDERARWRWAWSAAPAPGISAQLLPPLAKTTTLTLSVDFPLPTYRQPGRRRRLAERRERGSGRQRSGL